MRCVIFVLVVMYEKVDFGKTLPPKVLDEGWCCDILLIRGT